MKKRINCIVLAVVIFIAFPKIVMACSCAARPTPTEAFISSDFVFIGEVLKSDVSYKDSDVVVLRLIKSYKGELTEEVKIPGHSGMCTYRFEQGKKYLVYTSEFNGKLSDPSTCSNTQVYSEESPDVQMTETLKSKTEEQEINGKIIKIVKDYNADGLLLAETHYENNMKNGVYKTYYDSGKVKREAIYKDSKVRLNTLYSKSGNLESQFDYDKMHSKLFYENGTLKWEKIGADYGLGFDLVNEYYESGELKKKEERDDAGKGLIAEYYKDGNLRSESPTQKREGSSCHPKLYTNSYYEDGALKSVKKYESREYCAQDVISEIFYDKSGNLKEGAHKEFHENGNLESEYQIEAGKIEGLAKLYDDKGELTGESLYKNGVLDGMTNYYRSDGTVRTANFYKEGKIQKYIIYDEAGNVMRGYDYLKKEPISPESQ